MSLITEENRAKATIYRGKEIIKEQVQKLLRKLGLPNGLLPLDDPEEFGYVEETGFTWIKQKKKTEHKFEKIGSRVAYGTEITAYVEPTKMKKITGVKARELMIWLSPAEITVAYMNADKVTFKSSTGIFRTHPAEAFMAQDAKEAKEVEIVSESAARVGCQNFEAADSNQCYPLRQIAHSTDN